MNDNEQVEVNAKAQGGSLDAATIARNICLPGSLSEADETLYGRDSHTRSKHVSESELKDILETKNLTPPESNPTFYKHYCGRFTFGLGFFSNLLGFGPRFKYAACVVAPVVLGTSLFLVGETFVFALNVPITLQFPVIPYVLPEDIRDTYFTLDLSLIYRAFMRTRTRELRFDFNDPSWSDASNI